MSDDHLPEGRALQFLPPDHAFIKAARDFALEHSLDKGHPTGAVVVREGEIVAFGANGSLFHERVGCIRKMLRVPSGKAYWICPGCWTRNHAEQKALAECRKKGIDTKGLDLYLWGHSYCCRWCWAAMEKAGVRDVYLKK